MMQRFLWGAAVIVLIIGLFFLIAPRQAVRSTDAGTLDDFITALMEEEAIPGLAIAIIEDRNITHLQGYGFADVEALRAMSPDTPMNIASISKPIMGIALLQLKDRGLLDLDADINTYLPFSVDNPYIDDEIITLRNLATHTSGIADYLNQSLMTNDADSPIALEHYLESLLTPSGSRYGDGAQYLETRPGTAREYSNLGAGVAGAVAEAAGKSKLRDLMAENVFGPIGMTQTSWMLEDFAPDTLAKRYEVTQCAPFIGLCSNAIKPVSNFLIGAIFNPPLSHKRFSAYPHYGNPNYPDGGVHSSVSDLATLTLTILNNTNYQGGALLTPVSFEEMISLQLPAEISTRQRFFWRDRYGLTGHTGSDRGVFTSLYFDAEKGNAVIVLMNRTPDGGTEIAMEQIIERVKVTF